MERRRFLTLGALGIASVSAGCSGSGDRDDEPTPQGTDSRSSATTTTLSPSVTTTSEELLLQILNHSRTSAFEAVVTVERDGRTVVRRELTVRDSVTVSSGIDTPGQYRVAIRVDGERHAHDYPIQSEHLTWNTDLLVFVEENMHVVFGLQD